MTNLRVSIKAIITLEKVASNSFNYTRNKIKIKLNNKRNPSIKRINEKNVGFLGVFQHLSLFLGKSICCEPNVSIETVATQCGIRILQSLRYATWTYLHRDRYFKHEHRSHRHENRGRNVLSARHRDRIRQNRLIEWKIKHRFIFTR